ncbi:hemerythrin hhe cation binding domain-containing protein [Moniliophthora roreri MCA 2997]|uniref:Hemerythrin hhe cation binding domain-containing protein n=1 Tax=Moniliophthora roreri (strain MCA 2997) TaxID=1381753 RepID=V2XER5_MONRO|nr:hemerythrin hhe cation binding domain-containing protein [Moniliophthora roreri MCA 2997]
MGSSRFLASFVALVAVFASFKFYNNPAISEIVMTGPDMEAFETPEVLKHVKRMQEVATLERPALPSEQAGWAMAWLHLVIWNSWKSAYYYADKYSKDDFKNYAEYALTAVEFLEGHHDAEEQALFPAIEKKAPGSMAKNEAQHESFLKPLGELRSYIESTKSGSTAFDATTYRKKVDGILLPIMEHLADELDTLQSSSLLKNFTEDEIGSLNTLAHKARKGDSHKNLPFILQVRSMHKLSTSRSYQPCIESSSKQPIPSGPGIRNQVIGTLVLLLEVQSFVEIHLLSDETYTPYQCSPNLVVDPKESFCFRLCFVHVYTNSLESIIGFRLAAAKPAVQCPYLLQVLVQPSPLSSSPALLL